MGASFSLNLIPQWEYDVFLSFRGDDTRNNFISHLYAALRDKAIETFIDYELEKGEEISPALLKAIQESKISIIILSKNYASSSWCLDELLKILECKNTLGQLVVPVFYHVDPSHVRNQTGSFARAFAEHELKGKVDQVHKWRDALREVANLSGWHSGQHDRPETILLHDIIEDIMKKLYDLSSGDFNEYQISSSDFNGLVGIDSRIEKIKSLLRMELKSTCIVVGIWGMGGIGKTTIVRAIFNQISGQFPDYYFLENVREVSEKHGVDSLRKELLGQILKDENIKRGTVNLKSTFISERLGRKKVLIVLDDVNDLRQLESIIGLDQFGKGSRIIITTRNLEVLRDGVHGVYKVEELNYPEALRLFCLKAFKQNDPIEDFMDLSNEAVKYAAGIPLALEVLGRFLFRRSKEEWRSELDKLKETPNMDIQKVLRISYEGLDLKQKDIFCDIACFFKGEDKDVIIKILNGCGLYAKIGISVLIEKSLITISNNKLCIHDLLQEMGWQIVREVSEELGKRSRLWNHEDVCHVLTEETGTEAVKGIFLDLSKISKVYISSDVFKKMCNLRLLKFYFPLPSQVYGGSDKLHFHEGLKYLPNKLSYLYWERYPLKSLPLNFHPKNLVELDMSYSKLQHLWEGTQSLSNLRKIKLNDCKDLIKIPDLSGAPNLEHIKLKGCESLLKVHSSIQYLRKLMVLNLGRCKKLTSLPSTIDLKSLTKLYLYDCSNLKEFLEISGNIEELDLSRIPMEDLPSSIKYLFGISMQCLWKLNLNDCNLLKIPDSLSNLSSLAELTLRGNNFVSIPAIKHLSQLIYLDLSDCKRLQSLPELPSCLTYILAENCMSLQTISISSSISAIEVPEAEQNCSMAFHYRNCFKLDQNSRSKIEADAQLKIQLLATIILKKNFYIPVDPFSVVCPGSEIPEWFTYRSRGSLVTAQLPLLWGNSKFIGFAVCAVVAFNDPGPLCLKCKMKSNNGKYDILSQYSDYSIFESEHMILWYGSWLELEVRKFQKVDWFRYYCYNEASFQFEADFCRIEKCGVHLLYAQDGDVCNPSMIQSRSPNESFGDDEVKTPLRSVSFNSRNLEPTILKSLGSGKMVVEGSVCFKGKDLETIISIKDSSVDKENNVSITPISTKSIRMDNQSSKSDSPVEVIRQLPILDPSSPKHKAAIKLQKVYKSFRTRRKLADCAVLVEQSWWKLLDFAELKRSSISFFDIEEHKTANSRWSRARTKVAKVGKGLSKNDKAQKLALQHWLEAIDPQHRYGHNLNFYYDEWFFCQSREPFFYWLDIGEGREVNLVEKCSRSKLQQQCIKYLGPMERKAYEVVVKDGKFLYKQTGELLHTTGEHPDAKWIFVLSTSKTLYIGKKKKGTFQASSFLAGGATTAAGRVVIESGILKAVWPYSGHYLPTEENFKDFVSFLKENNVDLTDVKSPMDDEEDSLGKHRSRSHIRSNSSEEDLTDSLNSLETEEINGEDLTQEKTDSMEQETSATLKRTKSRGLCNLSRKLTNLEIPKQSELFETVESDNLAVGASGNSFSVESPVDGYESAEDESALEQDHMVPKPKLFDEEQEENEVEIIPEVSILQRIIAPFLDFLGSNFGASIQENLFS